MWIRLDRKLFAVTAVGSTLVLAGCSGGNVKPADVGRSQQGGQQMMQSSAGAQPAGGPQAPGAPGAAGQPMMPGQPGAPQMPGQPMPGR